MALRAAACLAASVLALGTAQAAVSTDGSLNILLLIADDLGVDNVSVYGEQPLSTAQTPTLDALANDGVMFRHAWANPMCSPSRAAIMTGRHAFRHGVSSPGGNGTLPADEETLAEVLSAAGYATALFGKWHLGRSGDNLPTGQGFDHFSGALANLDAYFDWNRSESSAPGELQTVSEAGYATSVNVDQALTWIGAAAGQPWFVTLAFNAPHGPFHVPPEGLYNRPPLSGAVGEICRSPAPDASEDCYRAMVEAMDTEIQRLLDGLTALGELERTLIVFIGDNGTPGGATLEEAGTPFSSQHAKGTVYEGGINVPLIISGGTGAGIDVVGVASRDQQAKVMAVDLFATLAEAGGAQPASGAVLDGISLLPYLDDATENPQERATVYSELYGSGDALWTVSNGTLKLISDQGQQQCHHLVRDAAENRDLLRRSNNRSATCLDLALERPCEAGVDCLGD